MVCDHWSDLEWTIHQILKWMNKRKLRNKQFIDILKANVKTNLQHLIMWSVETKKWSHKRFRVSCYLLQTFLLLLSRSNDSILLNDCRRVFFCREMCVYGIKSKRCRFTWTAIIENQIIIVRFVLRYWDLEHGNIRDAPTYHLYYELKK